MAVIAFIGGVGFWFTFRGLDKEEDHLNMMPVGHLVVTKDIEEPVENPIAHEIKE
jgi:POT family proton-dependent oligopeptide transporter